MDEIEDMPCYAAAGASHRTNAKQQKELDRLFDTLQMFTDTYDDQGKYHTQAHGTAWRQVGCKSADLGSPWVLKPAYAMQGLPSPMTLFPLLLEAQIKGMRFYALSLVSALKLLAS